MRLVRNLAREVFRVLVAISADGGYFSTEAILLREISRESGGYTSRVMSRMTTDATRTRAGSLD
jgi:hypothetical protein